MDADFVKSTLQARGIPGTHDCYAVVTGTKFVDPTACSEYVARTVATLFPRLVGGDEWVEYVAIDAYPGGTPRRALVTVLRVVPAWYGPAVVRRQHHLQVDKYGRPYLLEDRAPGTRHPWEAPQVFNPL